MGKLFERIRQGEDPKQVLTADLFNKMFDYIERAYGLENLRAGPGLLKSDNSVSFNRRPFRSGGSTIHPFKVKVKKEEDTYFFAITAGKLNNLIPQISALPMPDPGLVEAPTAAGTYSVLITANYTGEADAFPSSATFRAVPPASATLDETALAQVVVTVTEGVPSYEITQFATGSLGARRAATGQATGPARQTLFWHA